MPDWLVGMLIVLAVVATATLFQISERLWRIIQLLERLNQRD